jgi:hypothetical protein
MGFEDANTELNHLGTVRLQVIGTRSVVCARTIDIVKFLQAQAGPGSAPTLPDVYTWLRELTIATAKDFAATNKLLYATTGPGDTIFLPPGFVMHEKVVLDGSKGAEAKQNVTCRVQTLFKHDLTLLEPINVHLTKIGKPNKSLGMVVDKLTLAQ